MIVRPKPFQGAIGVDLQADIDVRQITHDVLLHAHGSQDPLLGRADRAKATTDEGRLAHHGASAAEGPITDPSC